MYKYTNMVSMCRRRGNKRRKCEVLLLVIRPMWLQ
jgi:hypothetical protein